MQDTVREELPPGLSPQHLQRRVGVGVGVVVILIVVTRVRVVLCLEDGWRSCSLRGEGGGGGGALILLVLMTELGAGPVTAAT